jgi:carbon monoxide dehydrogenase subunit G
VKLRGQTTIDAPPDHVWAIVAHRFDRIGEWASPIPDSRINSNANTATGAPVAGRICSTGLPLFGHVAETIVDYSEVTRTLTYRGEGMPRFVRDARNRWQVTELAGGGSRVTIEATLETRGVLARLFALPLRLQLNRQGRRMLADLKHYAETGEPSPKKVGR